MSKKDKKKRETIEGAIAGGIIGAALGAMLTGKKSSTITSALVGAAIGASIKALKEAEEVDMPVLYEEDGIVYKVYPNGEYEIVKKLEKPYNDIPPIPPSFTIE